MLLLQIRFAPPIERLLPYWVQIWPPRPGPTRPLRAVRPEVRLSLERPNRTPAWGETDPARAWGVAPSRRAAHRAGDVDPLREASPRRTRCLALCSFGLRVELPDQDGQVHWGDVGLEGRVGQEEVEVARLEDLIGLQELGLGACCGGEKLWSCADEVLVRELVAIAGDLTRRDRRLKVLQAAIQMNHTYIIHQPFSWWFPRETSTHNSLSLCEWIEDRDQMETEVIKLRSCVYIHMFGWC